MNLMSNYLKNRLREYIFIILTATIFSVAFFSKSFSSENVFIIDKVEVTGNFDTNFSRKNYIDKAFSDSFRFLRAAKMASEKSSRINSRHLSLKK